MAIVFTTEISTTQVLSSFNNSVVSFSSDIVKTAVSCDILIDNGVTPLTFTITPISDVFEFNFKEIVKTLLTQNQFDERLIPAYLEWYQNGIENADSFDVDYTITFDDLTTDSDSLTYVFDRSVRQIYSTANKPFPIVAPLVWNNKELTIFKGYPTDLYLYLAGNFSLYNETTNKNKTFTAASEQGKLWLSKGEFELSINEEEEEFIARFSGAGSFIYTNPCSDLEANEDPFFRIGVNNMFVSDSISGENTRLTITQKDVCEGVFVRWINDEGSWSYWLFGKVHTDSINGSSTGTVDNDFYNLNDTQDSYYAPTLSLGTAGVNTLNLNYQGLSESEHEQIKSVVTSPRVELYNKGYGELVERDSFQTVIRANGSITKNTKRGTSNISISLLKNKYTQR